METKEQRSLEMRGVAAVVTVILVLMGVSASLATKEEAVAPSTEVTSAESTYRDPSLAGLIVPSDVDAPADGEVHIYY